MADDDVTQDVAPEAEPATQDITDLPTGTHLDGVLTDVDSGQLVEASDLAKVSEYVPLEQPRTEHRPPPSEPVHYQPYE